MKRRIILLIAVSVFAFGSSGQQSKKPERPVSNIFADELVSSCATIDNPQGGFLSGPCLNYIEGFVDMHSVYGELTDFCLPEHVTPYQLAKVVVKYGNDHPEKLHMHAAVVVYVAFTKAFPCS